MLFKLILISDSVREKQQSKSHCREKKKNTLLENARNFHSEVYFFDFDFDLLLSLFLRACSKGEVKTKSQPARRPVQHLVLKSRREQYSTSAMMGYDTAFDLITVPSKFKLL